MSKKKDHYSKIYKRFKLDYPDLVNHVASYRPHDYTSIAVTLANGETMIYKDNSKTSK